jgi:ribosomal protein S12 methylthiotransferase accessory factor
VFEVAVNFESFPVRSERAAKGPFGGALEDFRLVRFLDDHPMMFGLPGAIPLASFLVSSEVELSFAETYAAWEAAGPARDTIDQDLRRVLDILRRAGHGETIAVDQTTSVQRRLGLSTVRAIVPGLLPIDFGFGKCRAATLPRLRELPQRLGLRDGPLDAADINRVPHPYP